jgi:hypothetical protein
MNPIRWPPSCRFPVCVLHRPLPDHMRFIVGLLTMVTLAFGSACAKQDWIDRTLVTVDVTGTWEGSVIGGGSSGPRYLLFELEQKGATVKGFMRLPAGGSSSSASYGSRVNSGPVDGTVAGDVLRFRLTNSSLEGELTVSEDKMTGMVSWTGRHPITLRRIEPSSPPASPPPLMR